MALTNTTCCPVSRRASHARLQRPSSCLATRLNTPATACLAKIIATRGLAAVATLWLAGKTKRTTSSGCNEKEKKRKYIYIYISIPSHLVQLFPAAICTVITVLSYHGHNNNNRVTAGPTTQTQRTGRERLDHESVKIQVTNVLRDRRHDTGGGRYHDRSTTLWSSTIPPIIMAKGIMQQDQGTIRARTNNNVICRTMEGTKRAATAPGPFR